MQPHVDSDEMREAETRVGRTLRDKWRLDALIDIGGMAAVYAATHRNGLRGAVKILHRSCSDDPTVAARFRREGYIANKVAHPNSVRVLDDDVDEGCDFLVMELLDGSTLHERAMACGGKLSTEEVLLAADQMLDVLAAAHDASIVHRDLKPENVFLTSDGRIKVLDFGIAALAEPVVPEGAGTLNGFPMGTPAFMSPEQARGRWDLVGAQSDLWSVGATMFTLLSGTQVHSEGTVLELLSAIFTKPAPALATRVPDCPPCVARIVDRALQLHFAERWPDARTMQAAVRAAHRELYCASLPAVALDASPPRPSSSPAVNVGDRGASRNAATRIVRTRRAPAVRGRAAWRVALASVLVGVALGLTNLPWGGSSGAAAPSHDAPLAALSQPSPPPFPASLPVPLTASSAAPEIPAPAASAVRKKLPAASLPVLRRHRASIYDHRY